MGSQEFVHKPLALEEINKNIISVNRVNGAKNHQGSYLGMVTGKVTAAMKSI